MSRSTIRTAALALATAAAAATGLLTAGTAQAVPSTAHYQESWTYVTGTPGSYVSGVASCPAGTVVVGGGVGNGRVLDAQPRFGGDGYYAAGQINSAGPGYLSIEAVCAPAGEFSAATTRTLTQRVHTHSNRFAYTNTCAAGTTAYGGGISITPKSGVTNSLTRHYGIYANIPRSDGRSWTIGAFGDTDNYDGVFALRCQPNTVTRPSVTVRTAYPATAANGYVAAGYATCPASYKPYAGGAWWTRPGETISTAGRLTASYSTHQPDGWWASGPAYATDATLHVVAKCS